MVDRVLALPEKHPALSPRALWFGAGRASTARRSQSSRRRASSVFASTANTGPDRCRAKTRTRSSSTTIDVVVDRLVVRAGHRRASRRFLRDRPGTGGRYRADRIRAIRPRARDHHLLVALRLPGLGVHDRRDRAAPVLVQQPLRRLPDLRRHRPRDADRPRTGHLRTSSSALKRRCGRRPGRNRLPPITARPWTPSAGHYGFKTSSPPGRTCPRRRTRSILYGSGRESIRFAYNDGMRAYQVNKAVRGRHPEPGAALQGDRERRLARGASPGS